MEFKKCSSDSKHRKKEKQKTQQQTEKQNARLKL